MTGASTLMDAVALLLFENLKEGMETGRIADMDTVQTEVEAAIAELNRTRLLEGSPRSNDVVANTILEIRTLREKFAKHDSQLVEFQSRVTALEEEITQIAARTEACNLRVEQQQKENKKVIAAMEGAKASAPNPPPPCLVPVPSHTNPVTHFSRVAVVTFPGGPRTVTIHPPGSPNYRSVIRDETGDVIITFKGVKPLRREGAFRGPLEEIDWSRIMHVYGRPEPAGPRVAPPVPRWPDQSQPSSCPPLSRGPSDIIARQRQLSMFTQTDAFGRILAPDYLIRARSPSLPTGLSSSEPSQDSQFYPSVKPDIITTPASTPPSSPSLGRGKKRARPDDEEESVPSTTDKGTSLPQGIQELTTPTPTLAKREESHAVQGPAKRKKGRSSAALSETLAADSGSGPQSQDVLDVTRTI